MRKKYSLKFWITFWLLAGIFLAGWFVYWQNHFQKVAHKSDSSSYSSLVKSLPIPQEKKSKLELLGELEKTFLESDQEKTFLILFQNNMELRPGGGFIGSFGILKIKKGKVISFQTHDTGNFDGRIKNASPVPYPMEKYLHVRRWGLRDANFSPDFPTNVKVIEKLYYQGGGQEHFDGVIAITADVLQSLLKVTGPIKLKNYPGTYDSENAVITLEYQVEKGYKKQGVKKGERKSVMKELGEEIIQRLHNLNWKQKIQLANVILDDLNQKDIQIYFKDKNLENLIRQNAWSGEVNRSWNKDYLMVVDANLGAYKSDYYIKRKLDYIVDLTQDKPKATLKITYQHTAQQKDWMTNNYLSYTRIYLPAGVWIKQWKNVSEERFGKEFQKKFFGATLMVPIHQTKTVILNYELPSEIKDDYNLLIQKQAGVKNIKTKITIIYPDGHKENKEFVLNEDWKLKD